MRLCIVDPAHTEAASSIEDLMQRCRHLDLLGAALAARRHDVVIVKPFREACDVERGPVRLRLVQAAHVDAQQLRGSHFGLGLLSRSNTAELLQAIGEARPDAVHMNGLTLLQPLKALSAWCARQGVPLTVSYHGGLPRRAPWLKGVQRRMLERCAGAFFPTPDHARPWLVNGLLREDQAIQCMEVSSAFLPAGRSQARARTRMSGHPVFAWNAALHARKDPLTTLKAFRGILDRWNEARLYMIYLSDELEPEIRRCIAADPALESAVELLGRIPHDKVSDFLNSADFFLQSSRSEIGCFSVLEAMSCGVVPILSDIPTFRAMTGNGRVGKLFPVGDHAAMAQRVLEIDPENLKPMADAVLDFFIKHLSYERMAEIYEATFLSAKGRAIGNEAHRLAATEPAPRTRGS